MAELHYSPTGLHFTDTGPPPGHPEAETIIFGHGLLFGGWMFNPQIAALRDYYRCVAIDWRGQGRSPATADGYDMDTLAADAVAVIAALGVAPVHYVGLSMGGFIGQRIAARNGELLRSLTLLDTSADAEEPDKARQYKLLATIYRLTGIRPLRRQVVPLLFGPAFRARSANRPIIAEWEQRLANCRRSGISKAVKAVAERQSVAHEITAISLPTLVMAGAQDAAIAPAEARQIAELIPSAQFHEIPSCGHSSTLEQPRAVTEYLRNFIETAPLR